MYTKNTFRNNDTIIIPENYKGNAFHEKSNVNVDLQTTFSDGAEEASAEFTENKTNLPDADISSPQSSTVSSLFPPKTLNSGGILNNIGLEELVILGVLILLYQSEADNDILVLLFLLLFYK